MLNTILALVSSAIGGFALYALFIEGMRCFGQVIVESNKTAIEDYMKM